MPDGAGPDHHHPGEAKADAILSLARCAFVEKGFNGASMQDLARAAGMSAGNFYRYFASKEAIVEALISRDVVEIEGSFRAIAAAPDPLAALKVRLRETLAEKCHGGDTLWAEIAATAIRQPKVGDLLTRMEDAITRRVARVIGLAGGIPDEAEAERRFGLHARLVFLMMHGAMSSKGGDEPSEDALHDLLIRTIERVIDDALAEPKDS